MGMLQGGSDLDLPEEALLAQGGRELLAQELDGDLAVVPKVVGEVHGGHSARTELALDAVAVSQGTGEPVEGLGRQGQATLRIEGGYAMLRGTSIYPRKASLVTAPPAAPPRDQAHRLTRRRRSIEVEKADNGGYVSTAPFLTGSSKGSRRH
jgi:hypothetical protein